MTTQFPDHVHFDNHRYNLAGVNGQGLFEPSAFQLQPVGTNSACWRGFVCEYAVHNNKLGLDTLSISLREGADPTLNGVVPDRPTKRPSHLLPIVYSSLKLPISFTGRLLIADQFIGELSVNMGFHPAWKYTNVLEVQCDTGDVLQVRDVSSQIATIREQRLRQLRPPRGAGREEIEQWINSTFQLGYDFEL